jgi:hypothetical protein
MTRVTGVEITQVTPAAVHATLELVTLSSTARLTVEIARGDHPAVHHAAAALESVVGRVVQATVDGHPTGRRLRAVPNLAADADPEREVAG